MATVQAKLKYLIDTKDIIKRKIQYFVIMPDWTPFRKYADYIGMIGSNVCAHDTGVKHIPAPRIRTAYTVELPELVHETSVLHKPAPRIKLNHMIDFLSITHSPTVRMTTRNTITMIQNVSPSLIHETEVNNV